jgi:hypothetical protein
MAITKDQFKAANARGAAAVARGPIAQAARYDSRRGLIVITLEGGCEFAFPVALAEGLADAPRSKLRKIKISPNGLGLHWPLLDADLYVPVRTASAAIVPKRGWPLSATPLLSRIYRRQAAPT